MTEKQKTKPKGVSHQSLKERRSEMASRFKQGMSVADIAAMFDVSKPTVRAACKEHRVIIPPHRHIGALKMLSALNRAKPGDSVASIAKLVGVTRGYAYSVWKEANTLGLLAPLWGVSAPTETNGGDT